MDWAIKPVETIWVKLQTVIPPYKQKFVLVGSSTTNLFQLELTLFGLSFTTLYASPEIIKPTAKHGFPVLMSNLPRNLCDCRNENCLLME